MICYSCGTRISNNNSGTIKVCSNFCHHLAIQFHKINPNNVMILPKVCGYCNLDISGVDYRYFQNDQTYCSLQCSQKN